MNHRPNTTPVWLTPQERKTIVDALHDAMHLLDQEVDHIERWLEDNDPDDDGQTATAEIRQSQDHRGQLAALATVVRFAGGDAFNPREATKV